MKIRCLDSNTFLFTIKQHTILINCPLETQRQQPHQQQENTTFSPTADSYETDLDRLLSTYQPSAKQSLTQTTTWDDKSKQQPTVSSRMIDLDGVDVNSIDVVLITQYEHMLGLPYLTEYLGYKGKIIATEPTIEFARQRMEELVAYRTNKFNSMPFSSSGATMGWQSLYTFKDVASCVKKIQPVRYNEKMSLFSTLDVMAYSSGYSLGSSNWLIQTSMKKIVILSTSSIRSELHPSFLDNTIMRSADVILASDFVTDHRMSAPTDYEARLKKYLSYIAGTLGSRSNVILPIKITSGLIYDLIWMIHSHLRSLGLEVGPEPHQIPIYMVSPAAEQSLQYANICGEWMTNDYQENLWKSEMPLLHGQLLKSGALTTFPTISAIPTSKAKKLRSSPCIVFTGDHHIISHGATDWFIQHWGSRANDICIFTDPQMDMTQLQQYDQMAMSMMKIPLDTRLTMTQLVDLLQLHWKPSSSSHRHLLVPRPVLPPDQAILQDQLSCLQNASTHIDYYSSGEMIDIDLDFQWEHVSISSKLAKELLPKDIPWMATSNETKRMAMISGDLQIYNNQLILQPMIPRYDETGLLLSTSAAMSTNDHIINVSDILDKLHKVGITDIKMSENNQCLTLVFPSSLASLSSSCIEIYNDRMIIKATDESIRTILREALL